MSNTPLPTIALSIRGLWAWLVANGFKDFEIRDWKRRNPARQHVVLASLMGRAFDVLIHASSGCTIREYEAAALPSMRRQARFLQHHLFPAIMKKLRVIDLYCGAVLKRTGHTKS